MDEVAVASRLEAIATTFARKIEERARPGTSRESAGHDADACDSYELCGSIKCLPVSCANTEQLTDVLDWFLRP